MSLEEKAPDILREISCICRRVANRVVTPWRVTICNITAIQYVTSLSAPLYRASRLEREESAAFAFYIRIAWPPEVTVGEESKSLVFRICRSFT